MKFTLGKLFVVIVSEVLQEFWVGGPQVLRHGRVQKGFHAIVP